MLTNKDVEKLKETFATKEDLKQFATKEEMNRKFKETNRHFDVVAEDLKNTITLLAEQISGKNDKIDDHEEKIENLTADVSIFKTKMTAQKARAK